MKHSDNCHTQIHSFDETAIQVLDVCKCFSRHHALKHVDMSIPTGQMVGLIGNNGSGKSVLLKCLCGLLRPTSGAIRIHGQQLGVDMDFCPEIGAVIESPGFLPRKSGYQNLKSLWALDKRTPRESIAEAIERVGLNWQDKKHVGQYSMGMRQRLAIAQALMENPSVLLLDEPFNGLDRQGVAEMYALIKSFRNSGITAIIASHNPSDIAELCSVVYEMEDGVLRASR